MGERLKLPDNLMYPVEITKLLVQAGDKVTRHQPLLQYKYWKRAEGGIDEDGNELYETREFYGTFESPLDGSVTRLAVQPMDKINDSKSVVVQIEEACDHSVQYGGLCAICGLDLHKQDYTGYSATNRAPIAMSHGTQGLTVSRQEAEELENASTQRLLAARKLILIVDLDQTVIHAAIDPQIGQWINDKSAANHEAVKDVKPFMLKEQRKEGVVNCWYYIKLRPGLKEFMEKMADKYEMHIYTMATKAYALQIAKLIDPEGRYFGDRILGREESGSMVQKSIKRLFPVTTELVTIIDDRGDVWGWSSHLVRAVPYNFFQGTGDINSGLLPRRAGLVTPGDNDNTLKDDDTELSALDTILTNVHTKFFELVDAKKEADIGKLLPSLKAPVFSGCVFLLSGIIPLQVPPESTDIVQWIKSFGALVAAQFVPSVTHVIASGGGTLKTRLAAGAGVPVLNVNWLFACLREWKRVPIDDYKIEVQGPIPPEEAAALTEQQNNETEGTSEGATGAFNGEAVDWDEMNKELEEFLSSDDEDSEDEQLGEAKEKPAPEQPNPLKRQRESDSPEAEPEPEPKAEPKVEAEAGAEARGDPSPLPDSDDSFAAELALSFD